MQTEVVEFTNLHEGEVRVTLSVPLPESVDRHIAEATTVMSLTPLCNKFVNLIAGSIHLCEADPLAGALALCIFEKKLSEAGQESLELARCVLENIGEKQVAEAFRFVMG